MIFLIEYDRDAGQLFHIQGFADNERDAAVGARLELEIDLLKEKLSREVVLLEAESVDALRATHSRYFKSASELAEVGGTRMGSIEMEGAAKVRGRLSKEQSNKTKIGGMTANNPATRSEKKQRAANGRKDNARSGDK